MARLFARTQSSTATPAQCPNHDGHSAYVSLLSADHDCEPQGARDVAARRLLHHGRSNSSPQVLMAARHWSAAAEGRPSWTCERPPTRKLVKDPNGSGRPSFSLELSDSDAEKDKSLMRRQIDRLKELYRRTEKPRF